MTTSPEGSSRASDIHLVVPHERERNSCDFLDDIDIARNAALARGHPLLTVPLAPGATQRGTASPHDETREE